MVLVKYLRSHINPNISVYDTSHFIKVLDIMFSKKGVYGYFIKDTAAQIMVQFPPSLRNKFPDMFTNASFFYNDYQSKEIALSKALNYRNKVIDL